MHVIAGTFSGAEKIHAGTFERKPEKAPLAYDKPEAGHRAVRPSSETGPVRAHLAQSVGAQAISAAETGIGRTLETTATRETQRMGETSDPANDRQGADLLDPAVRRQGDGAPAVADGLQTIDLLDPAVRRQGHGPPAVADGLQTIDLLDPAVRRQSPGTQIPDLLDPAAQRSLGARAY
ncbi:hypothetical protein Acor_16210 [Acrocarpospora corrugata]|uniref:Uncharacterized protein n=2 Tax=Acrocarpospora corrugata TaxID=35763 RepID=A0A5M3VYV8_9ACTN|nr:hypothetical protein Acor_16210 [Acrocarpospora corrugata]